MATDNIKIPEIKLKPMTAPVLTADDIRAMSDQADPLKASFESAQAAYEKAVKEKLNAIYGKRIEEKHEEEEWIWVDGYKGTDSDMTAQNGFDYKLSEMYSMDEDVEIEACKSGFHFCRDLKDVFEYYGIKKSNRFFKVRALVRKKDYEKYGTVVRTAGFFGTHKERIDKLAAKKIILERELTLDEIFFEDKYADWTEDEKKLALKNGCRVVYQNRNARELVKVGYSETFAQYVSESDRMTRRAYAAASQTDLSMDMKVFMIMYDGD